ncbi:hypothetical protein Mal64_13060 [Pseudobythopirellula maris]|uniref:Peptidase M48 domain-containing protein n=1 Tax=Pseudobythopirellula maris TaxID=2527991 RepID=A0A5C5ZV83_9BACT|nr:M48 family metallopeptidase [Pseudobythopirellula maris]TWT90907.1 hypothetical protein Mal64_13060 [Pseudobythopirellula maris]
MSTDFFERQDRARKSTAWLVGMFLVATVLIVAAVVGATYYGMLAAHDMNRALHGKPYPWQVPVGAGVGALLLIVLGTLYKVLALRAGGGTSVAESLGGRRVYPDATDPTARKLLNVVEEMALASGTPVPPVFLLEEPGINAFAAGYSSSDAVVGVTRGCAESLSRDELQGVIAHEFSHILNGDMRMSIRMIGILHGILLLGLIGRILLRLVFHGGGMSSRRNDSGNGGGGSAIIAVIAGGVALVVIGSIGSLMGGLIKAAVSRQREYLADASAVQFTRNPSGIGGALKRIGGAQRASRLRHPRASEMSHMYFAQGVWEGFSSLMATHPPLGKRIRAIEPEWDGKFGEPVGARYPEAVGAAVGGKAAGFAGAASDTVPVAVVDEAWNQVGEPLEAHRQYATELIAAIPETLLASARSPYSARALVYAMLLDRDAATRAAQLASLDGLARPDVIQLAERLSSDVDRLEARKRLPLVDLCLPALRAMSSPQYQRFMRAFKSLVEADQRIALFEWTLGQVLMRHLRPQFERVPSPRIDYFALGRMQGPCNVLLSTLAHAGHSPSQAQMAFDAAARNLPSINGLELLPREQCNLRELEDALATLRRVEARHRGRVVDACAAAICADNEVKVAEAELLRGVSDLLDCPMPPLLAGQPVGEA